MDSVRSFWISVLATAAGLAVGYAFVVWQTGTSLMEVANAAGRSCPAKTAACANGDCGCANGACPGRGA